MKTIGVLTSGGDAPGMNAAVRAVVRYGIEKGYRVYGIKRGYEGLIDGDFEHMSRRSVADILQRGGTILKTKRCKAFETPEGMAKAVDTCHKFGLDLVVVIGGNGSFAGALELSKHGIPVMGLPGTIDNDLGYTEQTIGFDTAVNTVLDAITRVRDTSSAHERTTIIEVMGRNCGDIAMYSGLAGGAECVLIPEVKADMDHVCQKVAKGVEAGKQHSIIIKAEGFHMNSTDVVNYIADHTNREVKLVVLSYLQRGGSPTLRDRVLATECAFRAIDAFEEGRINRAIGLTDGKIADMDLGEALRMERPFNKKMYDEIDILSK